MANKKGKSEKKKILTREFVCYNSEGVCRKLYQIKDGKECKKCKHRKLDDNELSDKDLGFNQGLEVAEAYWKPREEKLEREIRAVREYLWLSHGHKAIYGDDGEMQCCQCSPWDYKRSNLLEIVKGSINAKLQASKAKVEELEKTNSANLECFMENTKLKAGLRSLKAKELGKGKLKIILDDILVRVLRRHCELTNVSIPCCKELIDKQAQAILDAQKTKHKHIWIRQVSDSCHYEKCALCPKIRYK